MAVFLGLFAYGCSSTGNVRGQSIGQNAQSTAPTFSLQPGSQKFAILKDGKQLELGASASEAGTVFPKPVGLHVLSVSTLPDSLKKYVYFSAAGWDSESVGFGAIYEFNKVQAAIYTEKHDTLQRLQGILGNYISTFGNYSNHLTAPNVNAYFWQGGSVRLMVLDQKGSQNTYRVTIALGQNAILDKLRADPNDLARDLAQLRNINKTSK